MAITFPTIFDTNLLVQVVPNLKLAQTFLLDTFFPMLTMSDSEFVSIDVDIGKRRLAPFVSPIVEGKLVEQRRIQTNSFKPPYIKDKRAPDLLRPVRRMIGERIGGSMSPIERMQANIEFEMTDQIDMIKRRMEWMAAQCLLNGTLTITGDGFPSVTIDFGRASALSITLAGNAMWDSGNVAAVPAFNIDLWANLVLKYSGAVVTDIVFTPTPWNYFIADQKIRDAVIFDTSRLRDISKNNVNIASQPKHGGQYKGNWGGYDLWVYNDWYVRDSDNSEQRMMPDGTVIMGSAQILGNRAHASIIDPEFNYQALPFAPKTWVMPDPAQRYILMQSAPLTIPSRVNACLAATVTNANAT
jgi:hypothetical protein